MVSIAGFLLMVAGIVALAAVHALFSSSPIVVAIQAGAVALMVWARVTFGRRSFHAAADPLGGGLVTSGPYASIRHPIYTAVCAFAWAGALASPSVRSVASAALVTAGALVRMHAEERLVVLRYPAYADYARATKRMIPHVY